MDAKDILGGIGIPKIPHHHHHHHHHPPDHNHKKSHSHRKPDGISRELYALTGGLPPPLMPSLDSSQLKRASSSVNPKEKVTWQWLPFSNSARKDSLELFHWVRVVNGVPPTGDYSFAKYNKRADIVKYTDEEYEKHLMDPVWTKEETDQLFELCERFELRFVIIADRFPSSRSVEELKDRYYSASRAILIARASSSSAILGHPLVKEPYNVSHERERKRALSMVLSQTKHQERKDAEVLAEAKRISESRLAARGIKESELPPASIIVQEGTERDMFVDTGSPPSSAQVPPASSAAESAAVTASLRVIRVYTRTYAHDQMVQAVSASAGLRTVKRVEQTLQELGASLKPKVPTKAVCAEHLELRKEILTLLNLQKQLQYKEAEGSSCRDGSFSELGGMNKRGVDQDSLFIPEPLSFGGDRVAKKDQKRKGPGRDGPLPAHKRPRKLKASD